MEGSNAWIIIYNMQDWQQLVIIGYILLGLLGTYIGYRKSRFEKDYYRSFVGIFAIYGAFVWADIILFGIFWAIFGLVAIILKSWIFFLLSLSLFWLVRGLGETIYWFNQQFSTFDPTLIHKRGIFKIFDNDKYTSRFMMQVFSQCITVASALATIYLIKIWLS